MVVKGESEINCIRRFLKSNITKNMVDGLEKERKTIFDLLQSTIKHSESNSALLIGPKGAGKTTLVSDILQELTDCNCFNTDAVLVKLNGFIHTDDRLALKSITCQLELDNAVDGKVFGSFAENLAFLLACLKTGKKQTSKSIIFIIEEFDLFCSHHNQTLLYNLFDVSQSAQAPICVLGITCRFDVIELLEKRVKSRFSHRQIFLFLGQDGLSEVDSLEHRIQKIQNFLMVPEKNKINISQSSAKQWNKHIKNLIEQKKFKTLIQRLSDVDLNESTLKNILFVIVSELNEGNKQIKLESFQEQLKLFEKDDIVQVLQDLSVLELCLIIAMKHHDEIYDNHPMNFEMVLTRYIKFVNANANIQTVQRPVIMKAFEHIQKLELISIVNLGGSKIQKEYQLFKLSVTPQQIQEAVSKYQAIPTEITQWASSSLI